MQKAIQLTLSLSTDRPLTHETLCQAIQTTGDISIEVKETYIQAGRALARLYVRGEAEPATPFSSLAAEIVQNMIQAQPDLNELSLVEDDSDWEDQPISDVFNSPTFGA